MPEDECQDLQKTRHLTRVMWREEVSLLEVYSCIFSTHTCFSQDVSSLVSPVFLDNALNDSFFPPSSSPSGVS